jgi:hypothetical protein
MIFEKQTKEIGKHYLYVHLRLDTNEYFYVGVGTKYNHNKDYTRAKAGSKGLSKTKQRNYIWRSIVSKTDYKVIILFENDNYSLIKQKEIELIAKYGQIIKKSGNLCNLSDGGDGTLGVRNDCQIKPVYLYHKTGEYFKEFKAQIDCTNFLEVNRSVVPLSINKNHLVKGYIVRDYKVDNVEPILDIKDKLKKRLSKKVYQFDLNGNFIKEWTSSSEASRVLGISGGHIRECANSKQTANKNKNFRKNAGNFIWKYQK